MNDLQIALEQFAVAESALMSDESVQVGTSPCYRLLTCKMEAPLEYAEHARISAEAAAAQAQVAADDARLAVLEAVQAATRTPSGLASPYLQETIQHSTATLTAANHADIHATHAARCADPRQSVVAVHAAHDAYLRTLQQATLAAQCARDAAAARDRLLSFLDRASASEESRRGPTNASSTDAPAASESRLGKRKHADNTVVGT